ncbi:hypothetical protein [Actinopolyspora mortivallis]|uniref:MYXO-CTERM domain-containing protein n=1 Tax=Actinopolyspora mortivallis TaxID=33906 RepID=A0A2T0GTH8_ACTMO|nr:hypothetical protein [Actinopolyspora mortivallis]PRW62428.1 hypothetical protein CEP50_15420 [Actinopolyspora mortivallis]
MRDTRTPDETVPRGARARASSPVGPLLRPLLSGLVLTWCALFPAAAAAEPHPAGSTRAPTVPVERSAATAAQESVTGVSGSTDGREPPETVVYAEEAPENASEQDRRYVIGAVGVGLVVLVLFVRRQRGKESMVTRWRKRS